MKKLYNQTNSCKELYEEITQNKMEMNKSSITKTISWTIEGLSDEMESISFSPIRGCPFEWTFRLLYKKFEYIKLYMKSLDSKELFPLVVFDVRGEVTFKNSNHEICGNRKFFIKLDPSSQSLCFDYIHYSRVSDEEPGLKILCLPDDVLVLECSITLPGYLIKVVPSNVPADKVCIENKTL